MKKFVEEIAPGVVEVPGRRFPGAVIMGDTLSSIAHDVENTLSYVRSLPETNATKIEIDRMEYVLQRLDFHLELYEKGLRAKGIELPYNKA